MASSHIQDPIVHTRHEEPDGEPGNESVTESDEAAQNCNSISNKKLTKEGQIRANDRSAFYHQPDCSEKYDGACQDAKHNAVNRCVQT